MLKTKIAAALFIASILAIGAGALHVGGLRSALTTAQQNVARLEAANSQLNRDRDFLFSSLKAHSDRTARDSRKIADLEARVRTLDTHLAENPDSGSGECLSGADADWLRGLWD